MLHCVGLPLRERQARPVLPTVQEVEGHWS
jgi:hypothetical protein